MPATPLTMTPAQAQVGEAAQQVRNQAIGNIFGLFMSKYNDKRQLAQQKKLQALQIAGDKELQDYSFNKQLQMWKDTNYGAQVAELEKAGLNPGLLYGMSGGGGTTTGSTGGPSVTGGQAPAGGRELLDFSNQALQMGIMRAQKANIEADTKKKEAETKKTSGVDTTLGETQIKSLTQGIENQKAQETLTRIQTELAQLDVDFLNQSFQNRLSQININLSKAVEEVRILENEKEISEATKQTKIDLIRLEYTNKILEGYLIKAQTENVSMATQESIRRIINMVQDNIRKWDSLSLDQRNHEMNLLHNMGNENSLLPRELKEGLNLFIAPRLGGGHTPISGFHKR